MIPKVVRVPASLLLDRDLLSSTQLVGMLIRLHGGPVDSKRLVVESGLNRETVLKAVTTLGGTTLPWLTPSRPEGPEKARDLNQYVSLPNDLLTDRRLHPQAKVLYGILHLTPGFRDQSGQFSYPRLRSLTGRSIDPLKEAVKALVQTGWLHTAQANKLAPIRYTLRHPRLERDATEVAEARQRLEEAPFRGEAIMREYLSLLVDSEAFEDDAAPGFMVNPWTGERLELDRYYPPHVAFEFNGPQHYRATERFSAADVSRQRGRDFMKIGICVENSIHLVVLQAEDLSLQAMLEKVRPLLPLRDLSHHEGLVAFLESISRRYRRSAQRQR